MTAPMTGASGLAAYRATAAGTPGAGGAMAPAGGDGAFSGMLEQALANTVESGRQADAASVAALRGETGTTDVVMAVARAELALQTAVALRDRVVAAYQDVMRMQI
jgi:flagellar hook-basal body complex protein FliE